MKILLFTIEQLNTEHRKMSPFQAKALGKVLFEQVCRQLNLLEADYFGLEYEDANAASVSLYYHLIAPFELKLTMCRLISISVLVGPREANKSSSWFIIS